MAGVRVIGWHAQGGLSADVGRTAQELERQRSAFRRLGDLSREGIADRSEPCLRLAEQRLVRSDHPALERRRRDMGAGRQQVHLLEGGPTTHKWYDGTPHPWEFARVWHLEPSLTDVDTVYAGVQDAGLFRSTDGGQSWQELPGLRGHKSGHGLATWRRRPVPAHDRAGSHTSEQNLRRDLRCRRVSEPTMAA